MHKCNNCGTEYEGNVCPNCGSVGQGRKRCPNCGAIIAQSSKFCNGCGYSFESGAVPKEAKAQSAALVWINKHKIGLIISSIILVTAIILLSLIPTFIKASVNGTYYKYNAGADTFDPENYITLKTGKWTDSEGFGGNYKVSGKTVTLKMDMFGEEMDFTTATVENGMLSYDVMGEKTVYLARKHRHKYGEWQDKDELTCTQDETQVRLCGCGKEDVEVITEARGHQGNWKTTKEVTCTDYGEREVHCTVCDKDIVEYIEKLPHNLIDSANETTHYQFCSMCNQHFNEENHSGVEECSVCKFPFSYTKELKFELNNDGTAYTVTGLNDTESKFIRIPDKYRDKPVTEIGINAFSGNKSIKLIFIPNSVKSIGGSAFRDCSGLTSITIPESVTSIGSQAFYNCDGLTNITIPNSVTSIGRNAIAGCKKLDTVFWNATDCINAGYRNGGEYYGVFVVGYYGGDTIKKIIIGENVKSLPECAFYACSGITSITIPNSVTSVGNGVFLGCSGLKSVYYAGNIKTWCEAEIVGRSNLMSSDRTLYVNGQAITGELVIPNGVTSIGSSAFDGCSGLTSITFNGTKKQWKAIGKGYSWNYKTGEYTIQCTDGKLDKNGNEIE